MSQPQEPTSEILMRIYRLMEDRFGNRQWWPADTPEEVILGAILVQNVSWRNVERAIALLKEHNICSFSGLLAADLEVIHSCIKSTRFYKSKAAKLTAFAQHVQSLYGGKVEQLLHQDVEVLRKELLGIHGIGPETADDIVLYAANKPTFVIDAYTRRIFARMGLLETEDVAYESLREWFLAHLPADVPLLNQFHALLDAVGHHFCTPRDPQCDACALAPVCSTGSSALTLQREADL